MKLAQNGTNGIRPEHIDIKVHVVRDHIVAVNKNAEYWPTLEMTADLLTKPLPWISVERFRKHSGLNTVH